ncbi:MAG: hypothetical protein ACYTG7_01825 [Planctomycetota bacterium]
MLFSKLFAELNLGDIGQDAGHGLSLQNARYGGMNLDGEMGRFSILVDSGLGGLKPRDRQLDLLERESFIGRNILDPERQHLFEGILAVFREVELDLRSLVQQLVVAGINGSFFVNEPELFVVHQFDSDFAGIYICEIGKESFHGQICRAGRFVSSGHAGCRNVAGEKEGKDHTGEKYFCSYFAGTHNHGSLQKVLGSFKMSFSSRIVMRCVMIQRFSIVL